MKPINVRRAIFAAMLHQNCLLIASDGAYHHLHFPANRNRNNYRIPANVSQPAVIRRNGDYFSFTIYGIDGYPYAGIGRTIRHAWKYALRNYRKDQP
jgi:hypothetical protein